MYSEFSELNSWMKAVKDVSEGGHKNVVQCVNCAERVSKFGDALVELVAVCWAQLADEEWPWGQTNRVKGTDSRGWSSTQCEV